MWISTKDAEDKKAQLLDWFWVVVYFVFTWPHWVLSESGVNRSISWGNSLLDLLTLPTQLFRRFSSASLPVFTTHTVRVLRQWSKQVGRECLTLLSALLQASCFTGGELNKRRQDKEKKCEAEIPSLLELGRVCNKVAFLTLSETMSSRFF